MHEILDKVEKMFHNFQKLLKKNVTGVVKILQISTFNCKNLTNCD